MEQPEGDRPRCPRYGSLDLWRGVAGLAVVLYHAAEPTYGTFGVQRSAYPVGVAILTLVQHGWVCVPLFFVISGYCIAAAADSARGRPASARAFLWRRLRRIGPPYWAVLVLTAMAARSAAAWMHVAFGGFYCFRGLYWGPIPDPARLTAWQWVGNLTLTETWSRPLLDGVLGRAGDPPLLLLGQAWTLCYEVQFYAVCGLILAIAPRRFFARSPPCRSSPCCWPRCG